MKNASLSILSLGFLFFLSSCSQFAYKTLATEVNVPAGWIPVTLDDSYDFYYRAITSEDEPIDGTNKTQRVLGIHKDNQRMNPGIIGQQNQKIIEIEYLWVSVTKKTVIYISTVADRYQNRYSDTSRFAGLDHPNGADFRVFLIGKVDDADPNQFTFYFKDNQHTDNWTVSKSGNELTLLQVAQKHYTSYEDVFELNDAICHGVTFQKKTNWHLIFLDKNIMDKSKHENIVSNCFYYQQAGDEFQLFIPFTTTTLFFKDKYVIYRPDFNNQSH
jgi:hypothetical protein